MWLSAANSVAGSMRGTATAQAKRQARKAVADTNTQIIDFWTEKAAPNTRAKKKRSR